MTRFARAKGSKASNERVPEEATSWTEMKKQMEDAKNEVQQKQLHEKANKMRKDNYDKFLRETEEQTTSNWAEFSDMPSQLLKQHKKNNTKEAKESKKSVEHEQHKKNNTKGKEVKKSKKIVEDDSEAQTKKKTKKRHLENVGEENGTDVPQKKKKKKLLSEAEQEEVPSAISKKKKNKKKFVVCDEPTLEVERTHEVETVTKKKKKKKTKQNNQIACEENNGVEETNGDQTKQKSKQTKKKNNKNPLEKSVVKKTKEEMSEGELCKVNKKKEKRLRQLEKKKQFRQLSEEQKGSRRKPNSRTEKVTINGREIELVYFDGFPIKKEDGDRLRQLKKDMVAKGLPISEIKAAMKLERRRAEKALAREKKNVCFNCRKAGHNLSECPSLGDADAKSAICFKCGSTEHTHFQCKVVKGQDFRFASCFICKEQGHIARQCPDNARGLYPKGGACKLCGDVTHLKKDCPTYVNEQESKSISLNKIGGGLEDLDGEESKSEVLPVKSVKKIKF